MQRLVEKIAAGLLQQQAMLCCAESCTGGWIAKSCTDLAGSSAWFDRGFVTYSNRAKQEMLGIPESLILEHGAVSEPVVRAMVQGALAHSCAQYAIAVSGIAGPGGGSAESRLVPFGWPGVTQKENYRRFMSISPGIVKLYARPLCIRLCWVCWH